MSVVEQVATPTESKRAGTIGTSPNRPDGVAKVQGTFEFSSDLSADGCLWGATLRSPHPHARIVSIDVSAAWKIDGIGRAPCVITTSHPEVQDPTLSGRIPAPKNRRCWSPPRWWLHQASVPSCRLSTRKRSAFF